MSRPNPVRRGRSAPIRSGDRSLLIGPGTVDPARLKLVRLKLVGRKTGRRRRAGEDGPEKTGRRRPAGEDGPEKTGIGGARPQACGSSLHRLAARRAYTFRIRWVSSKIVGVHAATERGDID